MTENENNLAQLVEHLAIVSNWNDIDLASKLSDKDEKKPPLPMKEISFEDLKQHLKSNLSRYRCSKIGAIGFAIGAAIGIGLLSWLSHSGISTPYQITGYVLVTAALLLSVVGSAVSLYGILNKKNKKIIQENRATQKNMTSFFKQHKELNKEECMNKSVLETINQYATEATV